MSDTAVNSVHARPCTRCGTAAVIDHAPDATTFERTTNLTLRWRHAEGGQERCADGQWIRPEPRCPQCESTAVVCKQEAWGDATDCPDCGFHDFVSIGD